MHILFVTPMLPSRTGGARKRNLNLIKLTAAKHDVSVISLFQCSEAGLISALEPYCQRVEVVPFENVTPLGKWSNRLVGWRQLLLESRPPYVCTFPIEKMQKPLQHLVQTMKVDLVFFAHLFTAELLSTVGDLPAILSEHNAEFEIAKRTQYAANHPIHWIRDYLVWKRLLAFETNWVRRFPVCLTVSKRDAEILQKISGHTEFHVVPNGVESSYFTAPLDTGPKEDGNIIFLGTMNYQPNVEGVLFFCNQIWPLIRQALPEARFTIVGANPVPEVLALQNLPGVTVTGFVDDVRPYIWRAAVSVVPLKIGGGTRHKILDSLAGGCPVVSTTLGAEGLDLEAGVDLLIADTPQEFAACTLQLLHNSTCRNQLAFQGQQTVRNRYDWEIIAHTLEKVYQRAVEKRPCCSSA